MRAALQVTLQLAIALVAARCVEAASPAGLRIMWIDTEGGGGDSAGNAGWRIGFDRYGQSWRARFGTYRQSSHQGSRP